MMQQMVLFYKFLKFYRKVESWTNKGNIIERQKLDAKKSSFFIFLLKRWDQEN